MDYSHQITDEMRNTALKRGWKGYVNPLKPEQNYAIYGNNPDPIELSKYLEMFVSQNKSTKQENKTDNE